MKRWVFVGGVLFLLLLVSCKSEAVEEIEEETVEPTSEGGGGILDLPTEERAPTVGVTVSPQTGGLVVKQDTDKDLLWDETEEIVRTDPLNPDTDGDGASDGLEVLVFMSDPLVGNIDTDGDDLFDTDEAIWGTDPANPDTDGDKLTDGVEVYLYGTNPVESSTDEDPWDDWFEVQLQQYGMNPFVYNQDFDGDGLANILETKGTKTDPLDPDTDGDGRTDGEELFGETATNPLDPSQ